jgi:hypothetical protein
MPHKSLLSRLGPAALAAVLLASSAGMMYASPDPCAPAWTLTPAAVTLNTTNQWRVQVTVTPPAGCTAGWYSQAVMANFNLSATTRTGTYVTGTDFITVVGDPNPPASSSGGAVNIYVGTGTAVYAVLPVTDVTAPPLTLACPTPTGQAGVAYSSSLVAGGGKPPYTYAIPGGYVDGLFLNGSIGLLAGTPTLGGTFTFTVTVTDYSGKPPGTFSCSISIADNNGSVAVSCPANSATVGAQYSSSLGAGGGKPPYTFSLASGALPAGLVLDPSTGAITGTPTTAGTASFTAGAADSSTPPQRGTAPCTITIDQCTIGITGPVTVPGLSQYRYQLNLPAGKSATGTSWSVDKKTASVSSASEGQPAAMVSFANLQPDWITLRADFGLDGQSQCAVTQVALVKVDVGTAVFATPGVVSPPSQNDYSFLDTPPPPPASPVWVTRNNPGSDTGKFIYTGGLQATEPGELQSSRHDDHAASAFTAQTDVTLTSPAEQPNALNQIQVGFIQHLMDSGSASYSNNPHVTLSRVVTTPTSDTIDWLSVPRALPANGDPWGPDVHSDQWPWYDRTAVQDGSVGPPCSKAAGSWTCTLQMQDSPGIAFPLKYNPNDTNDENRRQELKSASATAYFTIQIGARTLDGGLGADEHYFNEAYSAWSVHFLYHAPPNLSITTKGPDWKRPASPSEVDVNVVSSARNHNIPYEQWIPKH